MKQTALDIFFSKLGMHEQWVMQHDFEEAKEMEKQQKLKHQLFIGKVSDIIGFEKTIELLKECNNIIGGNDVE